jgi:hypothetical protein
MSDTPKSTYVSGRLFLAGVLADPDDADAAIRRHDKAYDFALAHFRRGGRLLPSPASGGGDSAGLETKLRNWETAAMLTPPAGRLLGIDVLRRAALYEMAPDNPADEVTLRRVLDALDVLDARP